jgi:ABC-type glycerol-3-phosphate transport system substrate-binding protein
MARIRPLLALFVTAAMLTLAACGGSPATTAPTAAPAAEQPAAPAAPTAAPAAEQPAGAANADLSGTITVLTNRTDIVDTVFVEYAKRFNELYPNVTVEFEALRDYSGEVQIRMNTTDYGDVLLIPDSVPQDQLGNFFEPLGSVAELDAKYNFVNEKAFGGQVYGIAKTGNVQGVACNQKVLDAAGVTANPTTPAEFLTAMQAVKDNTDAIPVYTNYAAGWPLSQWQSQLGSVSGDPDYENAVLVHDDAPWADGKPMHTIYKLMHDLVNQGLTEEDPTTTDWESSKTMLGNGEIGCMFLGSWSIVQLQGAAPSPDDISYMPFPTNVDGQQFAAAGGDWKVGVNKNSANKEAALAWLWWFLNDSGFAYDQGGVPPLKGSELPPQLAAFQTGNVTLVSQNPAPAGEEGLRDKIDNEAEIGLFADAWKQRIVDAARGASGESFEDVITDLNSRWAAARAELGVTP